MEEKHEQKEELKNQTIKVEEIKKEEHREDKRENKKSDKKESHRERDEKINFKSFFGLLIILLGLFYLGKNMGWWSFSLNQAVFWPLMLMMLGLLIIGNRFVIRFLFIMLSIFIVVVLASSLLFFARSGKVEMKSEELVSHNFYQTKTFQSNKGDFSTSLYGNFNRSEVQNRLNLILDSIYRKNPNEKINIEIKIDKK